MSAAIPRPASRGSIRDGGRDSSELNQPVHREHADAAAIGQDRQPVARRCHHTAERLGAVEQFAKIGHPQHPGATERGVVNRIGTGSAPVWVAAAFAACAMRPDLTTTTGLILAAARAADMNLRASLMAST